MLVADFATVADPSEADFFPLEGLTFNKMY